MGHKIALNDERNTALERHDLEGEEGRESDERTDRGTMVVTIILHEGHIRRDTRMQRVHQIDHQ